MAYNNNFNRASNGYNNNNYQRNQGQRPQYKKSGAIYTLIGDRSKSGKEMPKNYKGMYSVNAWNVSKSRGLITANIRPYKGTRITKENTQKKSYMILLAEITFHKTGNIIRKPVLMNVETQHIVIDGLNMLVSPNGQGYSKKGKLVKGYFGTISKTR